MTTAYPWNGTRAREVIIEKHEPGVKLRDLEMLSKSLNCQLKGIRMGEKEMFKKMMHMQKCNERRMMRKLNQVELLEILERRGGRGRGGNNRELLELALLSGNGGLGGNDDDESNLLLATTILDDENRGGRSGRHNNRDDLELMMMNNRINKLSNNLTQIDTLLGVRPINPAAAQV